MTDELIDADEASLHCSDTPVSLHHFKQSLKLVPDYPQNHVNLAIALIEHGATNEARWELETVLRTDPRCAVARAYLGIELFKLNEVEAAREELKKAVRLAPTNLLVLVKFAEYYYRLGFFPRSATILEQALQLPYEGNEQIVALAKQSLARARQKCKGLIIRETPDPHFWLRLVDHLNLHEISPTPVEV